MNLIEFLLHCNNIDKTKCTECIKLTFHSTFVDVEEEVIHIVRLWQHSSFSWMSSVFLLKCLHWWVEDIHVCCWRTMRVQLYLSSFGWPLFFLFFLYMRLSSLPGCRDLLGLSLFGEDSKVDAMSFVQVWACLLGCSIAWCCILVFFLFTIICSLDWLNNKEQSKLIHGQY